MSIFDTLYPPRQQMEKDHAQKSLSGWSTNVIQSDGKKATFFDASDYEVVTNGYTQNPYVYAVVNRLAFLMAMVHFKVCKVANPEKHATYKGLGWEQRVRPKGHALKEEALEDVPDHEAQQLLDSPNDQDGPFDFRQSFYINRLLTGNMYIEALKPTESRPPTELWNLPPLAVTINPSGNFYRKALEYHFNWGVTSKVIPPELMMHSTYYHPLGRSYGLSPLSAARKAVQQVNDGEEWNAALLQNGAKPEYVLLVADGTPDTKKEKLKKRFMDQHSGPYNQGGEPLVVEESFMKFETLGYTVKDMDWQNSQLTNMRKVYDVYGVGSEIFNDPENKIQANKREALRSLYTDRVLPEVESVKDELERWLLPMYEEDLVLTCDTSGVDALNEEQDKIAERLAKVDYMTDNEKRADMGKEQIDEPWANMVWKPANRVPAQQFSSTELNEPLEDEIKHTYDFNGIELNGN